MKISAMAVDANKIEGGEWFGDLPEMGSLRLKVRGLQNEQHRKLQSKLMEAVPRGKKPGGRIDPAEQDRILNLCLANTILVDWDGLEDDDGQPVPFSRDLALKLLGDPGMRRFRETVTYAASMVGEGIGEPDAAPEQHTEAA